MDASIHQSLDILEMSGHPLLEKLLGVTDVDLVSHFTRYLVDDYRNPADSSVLTLSGASWVSAVTVSDFEIHRFHSFGQFLRKVTR